MLRPDGVYQSAVVSFTAPPSVSGKTFCALPLPYVVVPSDDRAIVILQRAGDDLRRARRVAVDEHDDRQSRPRLRRAVGERLRVASAVRPRMRHDPLTRVEKEIADADALVEQAARIAAQIEDQRSSCPRVAQRIDRVAQIGRRLPR